MTFDPTIPFNDLPWLPPRADIESKQVLKACISANRKLAELKGSGGAIPNQRIVLNAILLQEARLSSEIENIVTTTDMLYRASLFEGEQKDPAAKEALRYEQALRRGYERLNERPLSTNVFCELCSIIKGQDVYIRKVPGTALRNEQTGQVIYTPPEGEDLIRDLLGDLERFMHGQDDLDPLIKMVILHYQFEAIHPFHDGNGRTGRIINILYLLEQGLLNLPVLYLSRSIIESKDDYYSRLYDVTMHGAWEAWVLYMLRVVDDAASHTCELILKIRKSFEQTCLLCQQKLAPRTYSKDLMELIYVRPYCKISFLVEAQLARRGTASKYLQELEGIGVMASIKVGKEIYYINKSFMAVLLE